jgi:hypothetical protein
MKVRLLALFFVLIVLKVDSASGQTLTASPSLISVGLVKPGSRVSVQIKVTYNSGLGDTCTFPAVVTSGSIVLEAPLTFALTDPETQTGTCMIGFPLGSGPVSGTVTIMDDCDSSIQADVTIEGTVFEDTLTATPATPACVHFGTGLVPAMLTPSQIFHVIYSTVAPVNPPVAFGMTVSGPPVTFMSPNPFHLSNGASGIVDLQENVTFSVTAPTIPGGGYFMGTITIEDFDDPTLSAKICFDGTVDKPLGVGDDIEMTPNIGPSTFSPVTGSPVPGCTQPFCPIVYAAEFKDFDQDGAAEVDPQTWKWTLELFHSRGVFNVDLIALAQTNGVLYLGAHDSNVQIVSKFTLPSNFDWSRDASGNIVAKVRVDCIDIDGAGHHAEKIVGVIYNQSALKTSGRLACPLGQPLGKCPVTIEFWDSSGKLASQTTTTDANGLFEVTMDCSISNHMSERFIVSSPCCGNTWTIPTDQCNGNLRTLVCNECGPCVAPPAQLADWWPFDEAAGPVAHDIAGAVKNSGAYGNSPTPTAGKVGGGLCFNGVDNYVVASDDGEVNFLGRVAKPSFSPESFTLALWVKTRASGLQVLLDKRTTEKFGGFLRGYSLFIVDGRLGFQMATGPGNSICNSPGSACSNYVSPAGLPNLDLRDDQWHFVAVTVDRSGAGSGSLYVDGALVDSFTPIAGKIANHADLQIGRRDQVFGAAYFKGCMDELQIFKTPLSKNALDTIFYAGSNGICKPGPPTPTTRGRIGLRLGK